jgi:hypothetical protein
VRHAQVNPASTLPAKISDIIVLVVVLVLVVFGTEWGGFDVADGCEARNLNMNQDQQRSKTEDENDDEDEDDWGH